MLKLRTILTIGRVSISQTLAYRAHLFVWCLHGFIYSTVFLYVMLTVYGDRESVAGFTKPMIITYFFLSPLVQNIIDSWTYENILPTIKDGSIVQRLLRPINYPLYYFIKERFGLLVQNAMFILMMLCALPFLLPYMMVPPLGWHLLWLIPTILVGWCFAFAKSFIVSCCGLFTTEADWIKNFLWMIEWIFAGFAAPIVLFPETFQTIVAYLPFPILIYTPISIILNVATPQTIIHQLIVSGIWGVGCGILAWVLWRQGLKRLETVGL